MGYKAEAAGAGCAMLVLIAVVLAVGVLVGGWALMIAFGIVHSIWQDVPTISYWEGVALAVAISLVKALVFGVRRS